MESFLGCALHFKPCGRKEKEVGLGRARSWAPTVPVEALKFRGPFTVAPGLGKGAGPSHLKLGRGCNLRLHSSPQQRQFSKGVKAEGFQPTVPPGPKDKSFNPEEGLLVCQTVRHTGYALVVVIILGHTLRPGLYRCEVCASSALASSSLTELPESLPLL